ncbi:MAG: hypothetical protein HY315_04625, partial [Acidobacteria bacterium]|nr:hypothetical protein [Acidobacteriota bacterium]
LFLRELGPWIASAHKDAELGLGYLGNGYDSLSARQSRLLLDGALGFQEFCARRNFSTTWIDVAREPMSNLARHRILVLPQQMLADAPLRKEMVPKLRDYIRTGGTLLFTGSWPAPAAFGIHPEWDAPLNWGDAADSPVAVFKNLEASQQIPGRHGDTTAIVGMRQSLGYGQLILYGLNFSESPGEQRTLPGGQTKLADSASAPPTDADENFDTLIRASRHERTLLLQPMDSVRVTLLDSNLGPGRMICMVNFSDEPRKTGSLQLVTRDGAWSLPSVYIPPRDAQFIALDMPLPSGDFLLHATTEFLGQTRQGYLRFYAPWPANGALSLKGRRSPMNFDIPVSTRPDGIVTLHVIPGARRRVQVVVIEEETR